MSWWDAKQFTSIASNAIKNAQKKIDKVLDIPTEDEGGKTAGGATSSWSAWSAPSFLPSTPKHTFDEPASTSSSPFTSQPSASLSEPVTFTSPVLSAPSLSQDTPLFPAADSANSVKDQGQAMAAAEGSPPSTPALVKKERRRAARQRTNDKPPVTKKLGAVKLGAVKVQRTETPSPTLPSTPLDSEEPQAKPDVSVSLSEQIEEFSDTTKQLPSPPPVDTAGSKPATTDETVTKLLTSAQHVTREEAECVDGPTVNEPSPENSSPAVNDPPAESSNPAVKDPTAEGSNPAVSESSPELSSPAVNDSTAEGSSLAVNEPSAESSSLAVNEQAAERSSPAVTELAAESSSPAVNELAAESSSPAVNELAAESSSPAVNELAAESSSPAVTELAAESSSPAVNELAAESSSPTVTEQAAETSSPAVTEQAAESSSPAVTQQAAESSSPAVTELAAESSSPAVNELSVDVPGPSLTHELSTTEAIAIDKEGTTPSNDVPAPPHTAGSQDLSVDIFSKSVDSDLVLVGTSVSSDRDSPDVAVDGAESCEKNVDKSGSEATLTHTPSTSELITNSASSDGTVIDPEVVESSALAEQVSPVDADKQEEATSGSCSPSLMDQSTCSDNSYVKCELPVQSQKRAPSEFSDFETATSSDIEIISMASTYGDGNGDVRMMDFVPLSRGVFKTKIRDVSPDDDLNTVSPQQLSPNSDKDSSGKSDTSSTRKESENSVNSTMIKKVSQLTEVLEARENKLLSMSREHGELLEVNALLKRRIEQMEETNGDLDLVKGEFGQRLHELERKLQSALREKELVKREYMSAQEELQNRAGMSGKMQRMVEEKDEQITSLMSEGQTLAKQQLTSNNLIKKLRKKEKEQEELTRDQRDKIASLNSDGERLKLVLDSKVQNEAKHTELIKQLNAAVLNYQAETSKLKTEAEEALNKQKRAESAVDNSYKEIAELHKSVAAKDAEIKELKLENAAQIKEELQMALDKKEKEALRDADHLTSQIEDMQLTISRMEKEQNRREECLRQEKQDLLERLEQADKRSDDMTQSVTAATKPLLRQIENLQSSYSAQSMSWERVEKNLTDRLAEAQSRLAAAVEKERVASESLMDASSQVSVLESQLLTVKQEKSKLMAEVEVSKMKISTLQDDRNSAITQLETYRSNIEADKQEAKKSLTLLENKLDLERNKLEVEKKKCLSLMEQLSDKDQQIHDMGNSRHSSPSPVDDTRPSPAMRRSLKQDELLERALSTSSMTGSTLYDNMRNHSSSSLLENLESQVKQREGEITQLQADILEHEKTRESLTKEMLKLTEQNSKQETKIKELSRIQQQYKELNARYQALLQMYGEKEEAVNELKMDLIDVKQMYKQQIDALLSQ